MADHAWSRLKPSGARVVEAGRRPDQHQGRFLRGEEWAPAWATPKASDIESMSPLHIWGGAAPNHGPPTGLAPAPGATARWSRLVPDIGPRSGMAGSLQPPGHRRGWKRRSLGPSLGLLPGPRWSTDQRHYHFDASPCSELKLDEEMTMFESQITRTVSDHFSNLTSLTLEMPSLAKESAPLVADAPAEKKPGELLLRTSSDQLKRKRSGLPDSDIQGDCGWIHPLKLLIHKGLTVSDVRELDRIIIPKKDAESRAFPKIDTKEGTVLEMEDYTASKRWYFRFKYWINNKSRMYVLENTGEFIKYHTLKEHDTFIVYEDGCKNLVVCGQKKSTVNLDPVVELSKGSIVESSASETPTTTKDENRSHHQYR